jgi:hypothetical protein
MGGMEDLWIAGKNTRMDQNPYQKPPIAEN